MSRRRCVETRSLIVLGVVGMTAMLLVSLSTWVSAQSVAVVGSRRPVTPEYEEWYESSVAARLTDHNEVVVVATCFSGCGGSLAVAISEDGGQNFSVEHFSNGVDPGAVVDPTTDRIWVSGLGGDNCYGCVSVAWRDPEDDAMSSDFYPAIEVGGGERLDKPLMGISSDGRHILGYMFENDCQKEAWIAYSDDPTNDNLDLWTSSRIKPDNVNYNDNCSLFQGWGAKPVVLDDGRIVVAFSGVQGNYNHKLPVVAYSDDGGLTWYPDDIEPVPVAAYTGSLIEPIEGIWSSGSGDTPYAIDRRKCAPDIAVDRSTTPNDVYVAFYARADRNDNSSGDHNSDIYISKSLIVDGKLTFPGGDSEYLVQLTDEMLGLEPGETGPDQVMPSIAIDPCGGVNVVYYDNSEHPNNPYKYDVRYVRITDFGGDNNLQQARLTLSSFDLSEIEDFLGDYHHMALAGAQPTLYPAWIAIGNDTDQKCFINKISILCYTELSSYIAKEEDSCELFERLYKDGTIDGDLNGDEVVDGADEEIFAKLIEGMRE